MKLIKLSYFFTLMFAVCANIYSSCSSNEIPSKVEFDGLNKALGQNDRDMVIAILKLMSEEKREYLLIYASSNALPLLADSLLMLDIDPDAIKIASKIYRTPLISLCCIRNANDVKDDLIERKMKIAKALIDKKADVNLICPRTGETPLMKACVFGLTPIVNLLIDSKADVNTREIRKRDLINWNEGCYSRGSFDVDQEGNLLGSSALSLAVSFDRLDIARLLINLKADINIVNSRHMQMTPLAIAVLKGNIEMISLLVITGKIDYSKKNCDGDTVLDFARKRAQTATRDEIVKILERSSGESPDASGAVSGAAAGR